MQAVWAPRQEGSALPPEEGRSHAAAPLRETKSPSVPGALLAAFCSRLRPTHPTCPSEQPPSASCLTLRLREGVRLT